MTADAGPPGPAPADPAPTDPAPAFPAPDRRTELAQAARRLLETEGLEAITIRRLGAAVGIRGPSVYKHFPDKAAVEAELVLLCFREQAQALEGSPATFEAIAAAYRRWALRHPQVHRLLNDRPIDRARLPAGLEQRAGAPLVEACGGDLPMAQAAWATIKGLVDLELAERFPAGTDIEAIYAAAARVYGAGIGVVSGAQVGGAVDIRDGA